MIRFILPLLFLALSVNNLKGQHAEKPNLKVDLIQFLDEYESTTAEVDPEVRLALEKYRKRKVTAYSLALGGFGLSLVAASQMNVTGDNLSTNLFIASGLLGLSSFIVHWSATELLKLE